MRASTLPDLRYLDDLEVWQLAPEYRWLYNRLDLALALGYKAAPSGIWPERFPVVQRPIMNLYGMGLGAELVRSKLDYRVRPGHFWTERCAGLWCSYDVDRDAETAWRAVAYDDGWTAPSAWEVEPLLALPDQITEALWALRRRGRLPQHVNLEFIGERLIEAHPRWTAEYLDAYERGERFRVDAAWSESLEDPPPPGYTDVRLCDTNYLRLAEGKPARVGIRIRPGGQAGGG